MIELNRIPSATIPATMRIIPSQRRRFWRTVIAAGSSVLAGLSCRVCVFRDADFAVPRLELRASNKTPQAMIMMRTICPNPGLT